MRSCGLVLVVVWCSGLTLDLALAAPTPEQRKELQNIQKEVGQATSLVGKKQYEEAEKQLEQLQGQLEKLVQDAQFLPTDRMVATVRQTIERQRQVVAKALGKPDPTLVSFTKDVGPILMSRCAECHGIENPRANLDLSSIDGLRRGGRSRMPLVVPRNPTASPLVIRLVTPNQNQRMPQGRDPLPPEEIAKIAKWIQQGAILDSDASGDSGTGKDPKKDMPETTVVINKPTGNETVSFIKDIAPTVVNLCIGCHSGNTPRGGLSLVTFEGMMKGGDSGRVIIPGNLDGSRLWQLVGAGEQPRMPQGQARITRTFHAKLRTWIEEGAKYDGTNAKTPLRQLVPTDEELLAEKFAKMSPQEFAEMRQKRTEDTWARVTKDEPKSVTTDEFIVYGNVSDERLLQISQWATEHASALRSMFGVKEKPIFRGRLTIFVVKDRFTYTEFNQSVHGRDTANEVTGHSHVTAALEDAFIAIQDVGDDPAAWHPGLRANVIANLTAAYLQRSGGKLPEWVVRGTGLAMASKAVGKNSFIDKLPQHAGEALEGIDPPESLFDDGKFGPADVGPVGYTLVDYLLKNGGPAKFGQFISTLEADGRAAAAIQSTYGANARTVATGYAQTLLQKSGPRKKK